MTDLLAHAPFIAVLRDLGILACCAVALTFFALSSLRALAISRQQKRMRGRK